jgi:hypothetical protein
MHYINQITYYSFAVINARENWRNQSAVNTQVFVKHIYRKETILKTRIHFRSHFLVST